MRQHRSVLIASQSYTSGETHRTRTFGIRLGGTYVGLRVATVFEGGQGKKVNSYPVGGECPCQFGGSATPVTRGYSSVLITPRGKWGIYPNSVALEVLPCVSRV